MCEWLKPEINYLFDLSLSYIKIIKGEGTLKINLNYLFNFWKYYNSQFLYKQYK